MVKFFLLVFLLLLLDLNITAQYLTLSKLPELSVVTINTAQVTATNHLLINGYATLDDGESWIKPKFSENLYRLNNGILLYNEYRSDSIFHIENNEKKLVQAQIRNITDLYVINNCIFIIKDFAQLFYSTDNGITFTEIELKIPPYTAINRLLFAKDFFLINVDLGVRDYHNFIIDYEFETLKRINGLPGGATYNINLLNDGQIIINNYLEDHYTNHFSNPFEDITHLGIIRPIELDGFLYFLNENQIKRVSISDIKGQQEIVANISDEYKGFFVGNGAVYVYTIDSVTKIIEDTKIINESIPLNFTSANIGDFELYEGGMISVANNSLYRFENNSWSKINIPEIDIPNGNITQIDIGTDGTIFGRTNDTYYTIIDDKYAEVNNTFGYPLAINKDTLIIAYGQCGEFGGDHSRVSYDQGQSWSRSNFTACNSGRNKYRDGNKLYMYGSTYSIASDIGPVPNQGPPSVLYVLNLETLSSGDVILEENTGYRNGSVLIDGDGIINLNPQNHHNNPADSISLNAYISYDLGQNFESIGIVPRGQIFEGPDDGSTFIVDNSKDNSRMYFREQPNSEIVPITLSIPDLGKIQFLKYTNDGSMIIATENSHFYSAKLETNSIIEDNSTRYEISLFPNPVNSILNIESDYRITALTITNLRGNRVLHQNVTVNLKKIDVSSLVEGVYFTKAILEDGSIVVSKFIKY